MDFPILSFGSLEVVRLIDIYWYCGRTDCLTIGDDLAFRNLAIVLIPCTLDSAIMCRTELKNLTGIVTLAFEFQCFLC